MARPIPRHGSEGRYKGTTSRPGCRCDTCQRGFRLAQLRRDLVRLKGESNLTSRDVLLPHIKKLADSGMSQSAIARAAHVSQSTISYLVCGKTNSCHRSKGERILAIQPGTRDTISDRPALTLSRRMQALYAIGHGQAVIAAASGMSLSTVSHMVSQRYRTVDARTAAKVETVFSKLASTPGPSWRARRLAATQGWAPPGAWDDIDDPDALPDWTGHCGTDRGYWMHRNQKLPMCPPCQTAHEQWRSERAALHPKDLGKQQLLARSAASNRGAEIAEDGRELMRQGYDAEQAAARLGITRQHLQQELIRHPEPAEAAAA